MVCFRLRDALGVSLSCVPYEGRLLRDRLEEGRRNHRTRERTFQAERTRRAAPCGEMGLSKCKEWAWGARGEHRGREEKACLEELDHRRRLLPGARTHPDLGFKRSFWLLGEQQQGQSGVVGWWDQQGDISIQKKEDEAQTRRHGTEVVRSGQIWGTCGRLRSRLSGTEVRLQERFQKVLARSIYFHVRCS